MKRIEKYKIKEIVHFYYAIESHITLTHMRANILNLINILNQENISKTFTIIKMMRRESFVYSQQILCQGI